MLTEAPEALAVQELRDRFRGPVLGPDDPAYDRLRQVWNGSIQRYPAVIARCTGTADVIQAVRFARRHGLTVAVRGGGHNVTGYAVGDGGVVVDLSLMKATQVDSSRRVARIQPGCVWGEVDRATQGFGLAVPGGVISTTGIAGFTLGGGFGWISRKYGLACDNLLSCEVVTAEGDFLQASSSENPDLFWAFRGGGGNFGVVTSFEYQLNWLGPMVVGGPIFYPGSAAREVISAARDYMESAPEEVFFIGILRKAPPAPFLPPHWHGKQVVALVFCHGGSPEEAQRDLAPVRRFGSPIVDLLQPRPYVELQSMFDASWTPGFQNYWKSQNLASLSDEAIDVLVEGLETIPTPLSDIKITYFRGALGREPEGGSAFGQRSMSWMVLMNTRWTDPSETEGHVEWTRDLWERLQPWSARGVYVNFLGVEGEQRVREAYGEKIYRRLVAVKDKYDPDNFFRMNQNIKPSGNLVPA